MMYFRRPGWQRAKREVRNGNGGKMTMTHRETPPYAGEKKYVTVL